MSWTREIRLGRVGWGALTLCLAMAMGWAQTQQNQTPADQQQDIPDAPSAVRPPQPFPAQAPPPDQPDQPTSPLRRNRRHRGQRPPLPQTGLLSLRRPSTQDSAPGRSEAAPRRACTQRRFPGPALHPGRAHQSSYCPGAGDGCLRPHGRGTFLSRLCGLRRWQEAEIKLF